MLTARAGSVAEYLASLPAERKVELSKVRRLIKLHLPTGYVETMGYGMVSYVVPLKLYPTGYLGKKDVPLPYIGLASQKQYMAVYLMGAYAESTTARWFEAAWKKTGKKLDMGKSCLRFKSADALALDVLGQAVERFSVADFIALYERGRRAPARKG